MMALIVLVLLLAGVALGTATCMLPRHWGWIATVALVVVFVAELTILGWTLTRVAGAFAAMVAVLAVRRMKGRVA
jgi:hypothetical protein